MPDGQNRPPLLVSQHAAIRPLSESAALYFLPLVSPEHSLNCLQAHQELPSRLAKGVLTGALTVGSPRETSLNGAALALYVQTT